MRLYDELPTALEYDGHKYRLHPEWPCVLAALDCLDDEGLSDTEQIACALDILIDDPAPLDSGLLKAVFKALSPPQAGPKESPVMDFAQDWDLIYAGFWQAYGIDLFERRDMHWVQFSALLRGLPSGTRFADVIEIRQMDVPAPTKDNGKYRAKIAQMKAKYAIRKRSTSLQDGMVGLFNTLKAQAERGD